MASDKSPENQTIIGNTKVSNIFVNLPVKDLGRTIEFFSKLGFKFEPKFTDHNATCMIISPNIYAMLLLEDYFKTFTEKEVSDSQKSTEVLLSLQVGSREEVNDFVKLATEAGGKVYSEPNDQEWMYGWSFADLDGHQWELFFMDESKMPPAPIAPKEETETPAESSEGNTPGIVPNLGTDDIAAFSNKVNFGER